MGNPKYKTINHKMYVANEEAKRDLLECVWQIANDLKNGKEVETTVGEYQKRFLVKCATVYSDFDKFFRAYRTLKTPNIPSVVGRAEKLFPEKNKKRTKLNAGPAGQAVKTLLAYTKYDELTHEMVAVLERVRNYLERYVPRENSVFDMTYVKYWDCCHCGEIAPPGGHHLTFYGNRGWKYPVCPECVRNGTPIDLERLAELYYTYALQIEYAYNKIRQ